MLPADIGAVQGPDFQGIVRYRRRFGRPKNLYPHERVWLVIDGADPCCRVSLNALPLGHVTGYPLAARWEVTAALDERNELELEFDFHGATSSGATSSGSAPLRPGRERLPGGPIGEVRLEVTSSVLVDRFALETRQRADGAAEVRVTGDLVGEADTPLELVVLLAGQEAFFQPLGTQPHFDYCFAVPQSEASRSAPVCLPVWRPGPQNNASPLMSFEARLLAGASAVWSTVGQTAVRPVADWLSQQTSAIGTANADDLPLALPWDRPKWLADWRTAWGRRPGVRARVDAILSEAEYNGLDRLGVPVCQHLPAAWRSAVWPRLAHHPAIVEIVEH